MESKRNKSHNIGISGLNSISNLEAEIMKIVWDQGSISVREVHEMMLKQELSKKKQGFIPYTTVMSTMNSLAEKGLLKQDKSAKTYLYSTAVDRKELSKNIIRSVADKLLDEDDKNKIKNFFTNKEDINKINIDKLLNNIK